MRTRTRDTSEYGLGYVSGLMRMESKRTMANIGRERRVKEQNMQHFISHSPWSGRALIAAVQEDLIANGVFDRKSMLVLDESADERAGTGSVGASHQYNGRLGKIDVSQVGVYLTLTNGNFWSWIDGEVFIPEDWFKPQAAAKRERLGIPAERQFQTKMELGWVMIQRAQAAGIPFEGVACDSLYGRNPWLRDQCTQAHIECYSDVPANTQVYLSRPEIGLPSAKQARKVQVLSPTSLGVDQVAQLPDTLWQHLTLRPHERGLLEADFAARRVWTVRPDQQVIEEWLLIRHDSRFTYTLSNAPPSTPLIVMAQRRATRYFAERANQDAKSELGWDDFQATRFLAWEHHLALTILASWFITETRIDWATRAAQHPNAASHDPRDTLPHLSMANVREMLRAALPLRQLSPDEAAQLVLQHLNNRVRSRHSRLRKRFPS